MVDISKFKVVEKQARHKGGVCIRNYNSKMW